MERSNFWWSDGTSTAAKDTNMLASCFIEQLTNVGEVLEVAALIRSQGDCMCIFLHSTIHNGLRRLVVAQMNHFSTRGLNQPSHDVNRCIMAVKQGGCSNHTDRSGRRLEYGLFIGHADAKGCWFINSALPS